MSKGRKKSRPAPGPTLVQQVPEAAAPLPGEAVATEAVAAGAIDLGAAGRIAHLLPDEEVTLHHEPSPVHPEIKGDHHGMIRWDSEDRLKFWLPPGVTAEDIRISNRMAPPEGDAA
jgi:hypothetical protein